jgi:adenylate cyclase
MAQLLHNGLAILLLLMGGAAAALGQPPVTGPSDSLFQELRDQTRRDPEQAIQRITGMLEKLGMQPCFQARLYGNRNSALIALGRLDEALADAHRILELYTADCDSMVLVTGYSSLASVHMELEEYAVADSLYSLSISLWGPSNEPRTLWPSLLTGQAAAKAHQGDLEGSERIFRQLLHQAIADGVPDEVNDAYINMGAIKNLRDQLDSAIHYMKLALDHGRQHGLRETMAITFANLGSTEHEDGRYLDALVHLDSAFHYATLVGDLKLQSTIQYSRSLSYAALGEYDMAYASAQERYYLKDSLVSLEKVKALAEMQEKYESTRKEKEILGLRAQNLTSELERTKVARTRNIYLFSGVLFLVAAGVLWGRLRIVHRSRRVIRREKDISEGLLHNILPVQVANEMKAKGHAEVREFPEATVLFTDFKGFTQLSEKLTPAQLVAEIDHCFKAFDMIIGRHGVEKIKTIGDAYMAVGGVPDPALGGPADVVRAALEMQEFMAGYRHERKSQGSLYFEMRVGLHTGPVIAGIVGLKKFAYDIWGDTVNIASRMESCGEVGEVNISQATLERIYNEPGLAFMDRGHIMSKGKGAMPMYFVRKVVSTPAHKPGPVRAEIL